MKPIQNTVYLLLGGNLKDVKNTFERSKIELKKNVGIISKESALYSSKAWGFESDSDFLNQVIEIQTILRPESLLDEILQIELRLGRNRDSQNEGFVSRVIDIDILYYNFEIINKPDLKIPHYALQDRFFTLYPLVDIAPTYLHPILNKTNQELLSLCTDSNIPQRI